MSFVEDVFLSILNFYLTVVRLPVSPQINVGCENDRDCPLYNACQNTQCIDPCIVKDPCAKNAFCKVVNHRPHCTCPDGYIGSPDISCLPRKYSTIYSSQGTFFHARTNVSRVTNEKYQGKICIQS